VRRTAKWVEKHGVKAGCMFTDSPYYGSLAGHRHLLVVAAHRNCSKHVTLELEGGKTMLVDDNHPVVQEHYPMSKAGQLR
jgi:hypothetical protein